MAYLSDEKAIAGWLDGADLDDYTWFDAVRVSAANIVQQRANDSQFGDDPVPQDYSDAASAAELIVGGWLWENRGRYTSLSGEPGSLSYTALETLYTLVDSVMPMEYVGGGIFGPSSIHVWRGPPERMAGL